MATTDRQETSSVGEVDLNIVSALQESPRAAWTDIAPVLGIGADTLAQRWQHMSTSGMAWIAVDEVHPGRRTLTFVMVNAHGTARKHVINQSRLDPRIRTVHATSGHRTLCLYLETHSSVETARCIDELIATVPGVTDLVTVPVIEVISSGADWRTRALSPAQRDALEGLRLTRHHSGPVTATDPVILGLQAELSIDGRASIAELAWRLKSRHHLAISESTVARRLKRMLNDPSMRIRCDVSPGHFGWQAVTMLWLRIPPALAEKLCQESASTRQRIKNELPDVRSFMIVLGSENLHVTAWLYRLDDIAVLESRLITWLGGTGEICERALCHTTYKRMGFPLADGRRANMTEVL